MVYFSNISMRFEVKGALEGSGKRGMINVDVNVGCDYCTIGFWDSVISRRTYYRDLQDSISTTPCLTPSLLYITPELLIFPTLEQPHSRTSLTHLPSTIPPPRQSPPSPSS